MKKRLNRTSLLALCVFLIGASLQAQVDHDASVAAVEEAFLAFEQKLDRALEAVEELGTNEPSSLVDHLWALEGMDEVIFRVPNPSGSEWFVELHAADERLAVGTLSVARQWGPRPLASKELVSGWLTPVGAAHGVWVTFQVTSSANFVTPGSPERPTALSLLSWTLTSEESDAFWYATLALQGSQIDAEVADLVEIARLLAQDHPAGQSTPPGCYDEECLEQASQQYMEDRNVCSTRKESCDRAARRSIPACLIACSFEPAGRRGTCIDRCYESCDQRLSRCEVQLRSCNQRALMRFTAARQDCRGD